MKTFRTARGLVAAAAVALAMVAGPALADHHAVKVVKKDGVGSYLADARGMTLYTFKMDAPGKSACAGDCVTKWPLYHAEKVEPKEGLKSADFATLTREDGQKQTTYKGLPLYYFAGDKAPGDTAGHKVKDVWFAAAP
jgi:predicted lipoprotein with Yx(FWY)xxD motif